MTSLKRAAFLVVSQAWGGVNLLARAARDLGWTHSTKLPVRTVGIGNVQAGGSGKTPIVAALAREASGRGLRVAILLRGYRSSWERSGGILAPGDPADPSVCGDEAALLHGLVPSAWIGVGADRVQSFERLQSAAGASRFDLVLLDDAFQHWKIICDVEVVAVTDAAPGDRIFREAYEKIPAEAIVVLTKGDRFPSALASHPNRVCARYRIAGADPAVRYLFVAAIGDPKRARIALENEGFRIEGATFFPDHHAFSATETQALLERAARARQRVLLTGKDWVKWRALGVSEASVTVTEPILEIVEGLQVWERILGDQTAVTSLGDPQ